jgi:hypothetical protein
MVDQPMRVVRIFALFVLLLPTTYCYAQEQLVLLYHEKELARFKEGSVITYKLKKSKDYMTSLILEIREFTIITSFDTIPFNKIERVSLKGFPHKGLTSLFGTFFMAAGAGYFAIDQVNSVIVHGTGYDNDPAVLKPSLILVGGGFIMRQLYKRSQRIRYPGRLLMVTRGMPFYKADF